MITAAALKDIALDQGADIIGVGSLTDIPPMRPPRGPERIMPEAQSVITYGIKMLDATLESLNWHIVSMQASLLYHELPRIGYRLARMLEKSGYKAIMVGPSIPWDMSGKLDALAAELSHRHCAVSAGLGVIGRNNLLVTPQFGSRLNLATVITNAPLTPDKPLEHSYCDGCTVCVDACPTGALADEGITDGARCLEVVVEFGMGKFATFLKDIIDGTPEQQKQALDSSEFYQFMQHFLFGMSYNCIACAAKCPVGR